MRTSTSLSFSARIPRARVTFVSAKVTKTTAPVAVISTTSSCLDFPGRLPRARRRGCGTANGADDRIADRPSMACISVIQSFPSPVRP
jgi:hypothetical protein